MRVTAGIHRNRALLVPGSGLRPTMDQVRQALFNILGSVREESFLDLYAGCGAVGIDALSRGAARCVFVDTSPQACAAIKQNLGMLSLEGEVYTRAAASWVQAWQGGCFDCVFLDPPYKAFGTESALLMDTIARLVGQVLVCEHDARQAPPGFTGLRLDKKRTYGETALAFYIPE